jgi:hypothetical protein
MDDKKEFIPDEMTIHEASAFWDTHSVADFESHIVEMEYVPNQQIAIISISADLIKLLEAQAQEKGISIETLVNLWVQEKLQISKATSLS